MHRPQRRRLQHHRILFFASSVVLCCIYTLTLKVRLSEPRAGAPGLPSGSWEGNDVLKVDVRELTGPNATEDTVRLQKSTHAPIVVIVNRTGIQECIYVEPETPRPLPTEPPTSTTVSPHPTVHRKAEYPVDLFSVEQRQEGWVILHIVGMVYMFVALAIVCDEFFVPSLGVITNKLEISDDVAGATFMAAGGSAPELFTSLIGVFISHSNVGIGTIVGSAVFNILFVIGMCAIFSREVLRLTWWPLFRDVSFYILDLVMLIAFFLDNTIMWWESVMLVLGYITYVSFMKYNIQIEQAVKTQLNRHMSVVKVWSEKDSEVPPPPPPPPPPAPPPAPEAKPEWKAILGPALAESSSCKQVLAGAEEDGGRFRLHPVLQRSGSSLHNTSLRSTIFQLMIHTLDPLREETSFNGDVRDEVSVQRKVRNKVKPLNSPIRGKLENTSRNHQSKASTLKPAPKAEHANAISGQAGTTAEPSTSQDLKIEDMAERSPEQPDATKEGEEGGEGMAGAYGSGSSDNDGSSDEDESSEEEDAADDSDDKEEGQGDREEETEEPLSLEWPEGRLKQAAYLILLPIVFPLWLTVPDVRNPASTKYSAITFIGSILWIAIFSYLMVWWAHQVGETIGISEEIMGLTILAAGTSIPDLITSVIVARKGMGDMAVSSSVGSNIFDITIGLPVPWLMYSLLNGGASIAVSSNGLFCAIVLLFLMLLFVIVSIAVCRWRMSRLLGFTMFLLYFVFLVLSVLLEDRVLTCPISI